MPETEARTSTVRALLTTAIELIRDDDEVVAEVVKLPRVRDHVLRTLVLRDCPHCEGHGWYVDADQLTGDPAQVQCEFCLGTGKLYVLPPAP